MSITGKVGCLGKGGCTDRTFAEMMKFLSNRESHYFREHYLSIEDALNEAGCAIGVPRHISSGSEFRTAQNSIENRDFGIPNWIVLPKWLSDKLSQNKKEQQMNAEMVKACSNDKRQAWCALPSEVREAMKGKPVQFLDVGGTFIDVSWLELTVSFGKNHGVPASAVVRLSPTVKADPEYDIRNASKDLHNGQMFWGCVMPGPRPSPLSPAPAFFFPMHEVASMANFAGIRYEADNAWHSCVRCDMGAPIEVRFLKP